MSASTSVCALIVTYFPGKELGKVMQSALRQVDHLVIIDNGSGDQGRALIEQEKRGNVSVLYMNDNLGIAAALNAGVAVARARNFDWVLTLDQDTICEPDMVEKLLHAYRTDSSPATIAVLAPVHFDRGSGHVSRELRDLPATSECKYVMTSGNLIPTSVFGKIGVYDDEFFIEYVDHDFCLRARKMGFRVLLVREARMAHQLGEMKRYSLAGLISFFSHNYQPVRHYYRARNRIILYRRHFGSWILHDQLFLLKYFVKALLVEDKRWAKVKATICGTIDGLLGRMGRVDRAAGWRF